MIELVCPICGKKFAYISAADCPDFPFCSQRCKLIDLDNWLEGRYRIGESLEEKTDEELFGNKEKRSVVPGCPAGNWAPTGAKDHKLLKGTKKGEEPHEGKQT